MDGTLGVKCIQLKLNIMETYNFDCILNWTKTQKKKMLDQNQYCSLINFFCLMTTIILYSKRNLSALKYYHPSRFLNYIVIYNLFFSLRF